MEALLSAEAMSGFGWFTNPGYYGKEDVDRLSKPCNPEGQGPSARSVLRRLRAHVTKWIHGLR